MLKAVVLITLSLFLLIQGIHKPFIGHHDWNGVFYSNIANNYLQHNLIATKLGQVTNFTDTSSLSFYTHYPPLMPLTLSWFFRIFGSSDLTARGFTVLFTLASVFLMWLVLGKLKLSQWSQYSLIIISATPMLRYYAKMPTQEVMMIFFTLLSVWAFLSKKTKLFYLSAFLNGLAGWAGYFFYPLFWLVYRKHGRVMLVLLATFLFHLTHVYLLTGSITGGGILDALLLRLNLNPLLGLPEPELAGQFTWFNYLNKERLILSTHYTLSLLAVSLIGFYLNHRHKLLWLLGFWGLSYPLIFSNVVFVHEYFNLFFWPAVALGLAFFINRFSGAKAAGLTILIFLAVFFERGDFYQALQRSAQFTSAYNLGQQIKKDTPVDQTALVIADQDYLKANNLFINFYAHRAVQYATQSGSKHPYVFYP